MSAHEHRRRYQRVSVNLPTTICLAEKPTHKIEAQILSLSEGGAFVNCQAKLELGRAVLLEIRFAETEIFEAKVVESEKEAEIALEPATSIIKWKSESHQPGYGVEFAHLKQDKAQFLDKVVQYFLRLERAGVRF